ncbi:putative FBD-associated F-box protein At5g56390 [Miscanthus floridulus]|uniref:putative FBD-associated F-box protein At5g56390 n=1 Tax=Miscanthus floridulus TaxID=154761 RepID=UPI00345B2031
MGWRSRSKRRRGASADLISGLCDNVLLRILEMLPDAGDAVRTGALSRRWRGLWTRASSLTFDSSSRRKFKSASRDKRFLDFVHNAPAQRAKTDAALDLEHLAISFAIMSPADLQAIKPLVLRSADAAQEWIRQRQGVVPARATHINLNDLPSSAKLEIMHWELGGVRLQLPAAAVFASLMDLSLENIDLGVGSGQG